MTAAKQTKAKKSDTLVPDLDRFAQELLSAAKDRPIEQRVDVFKEVARWVLIKNRLADDETDEGAALHGYRRSLATADREKTEPDPDRGKDAKLRDIARSGSAARWGLDTSTADDYGGSALDAIKSRLPRTDPRGHERDRDDPGGEDDDAGGGDRRLRAGLGGG